MQERTKVPFFLCRPGTRLQFEVFAGRPVQGVVKALTLYGPRNFLVKLSEYLDENGVSHTGPCSVTGGDKTINLDHATAVLAHGKGDLVFTGTSFMHDSARDDLARARAAGTMRRRGRRLIIDGMAVYAPSLIRALLAEQLEAQGEGLGLQPWEIVDESAFMRELENAGVVRFKTGYNELVHDFPVGAEVNTVKMKRFIQRNINRFKCDLDTLVKARDEEDERYFREEMERDMRLDRQMYGTDDESDDDTDATARDVNEAVSDHEPTHGSGRDDAFV